MVDRHINKVKLPLAVLVGVHVVVVAAGRYAINDLAAVNLGSAASAFW